MSDDKRKKVLLMGRSGNGKTSMRSVIFHNHLPSETRQLGATVNIEQSATSILGMKAFIWDCGGQQAFFNSYLNTDRDVIFSNVEVFIYVLDITSDGIEAEEDQAYLKSCFVAIQEHSPDAKVFVLVHKMDLVRHRDPVQVITEKKKEIMQVADGLLQVTIFATSIYNESLYKAWSKIVNTMLPNADVLSNLLTGFAKRCGAAEVVLFEHTTFLVIARNGDSAPEDEADDAKMFSQQRSFDEEHVESLGWLDSKRFERCSELIKELKRSCTKINEPFHSLEISEPDFLAVLEPLTQATYLLIISTDTTTSLQRLSLAMQDANELKQGVEQRHDTNRI